MNQKVVSFFIFFLFKWKCKYYDHYTIGKFLIWAYYRKILIFTVEFFMSSECQQIIMNFSSPPTVEDIEVIALSALDDFPEELIEIIENLVVQVEEAPDEVTEADMELDDIYELLALYKSGSEIEPGVKKINSEEDDVLVLYRRAILDLWCETYDDLSQIIRQVMVEELARSQGMSDEDIDDMLQRHYQGML